MDRNTALKAFGTFMSQARSRAGLTQLSLGSELGFQSGQFISNIERGIRKLPPKYVGVVAKALNIEEPILIEYLVQIEKSRIQSGVHNVKN